MRNPVHRFEVDLRDPYEQARRSLSRPSGGRAVGWLLTGAALIIGGVVGWQISQQPAPVGASVVPAEEAGLAAAAGPELIDILTIEPGNPVATRSGAPAARRIAPAPGTANPFEDPAGTAAQAWHARTWPIIVYRAGDGAFYADLTLDDRIITARVDPTAAASSLAPQDLPTGVADTIRSWQAAGPVLEHLRLPATTFAVTDAVGGESVIGGDLLARYFTIEEQPDRLRLVPRRPD